MTSVAFDSPATEAQQARARRVLEVLARGEQAPLEVLAFLTAVRSHRDPREVLAQMRQQLEQELQADRVPQLEQELAEARVLLREARAQVRRLEAQRDELQERLQLAAKNPPRARGRR